VLSDGKDTGSANPLPAAVAAVRGKHVETVSLTTSETDLAALQALGPVTAAEDPNALSAAFARVAGMLTEVVAKSAPTTTTTVYTRAKPSAEALDPSESAFPWIPALAVFGSLLALVLLLWPRQRVSRARLGIQQPKRMSEMGERTISVFEEMARQGDLASNLSIANIGIKPGEFVAVVAVVAGVAGMVGLLLGAPLAALVLPVVVCLGAQLYVQRQKNKRRNAFAEQMPELLQMITTSLRSGYGINLALDSVAEEADEPARSEFAQVLTEARLGRDMSESLRAMAKRMDNVDLEWVVGAIDINRETGGNLSETLGKVGETVRGRERLHRQVLTITAEGRLSARILMCFPFVMGLWQWRVNPEAFSMLFHGIGLIALFIGAVLMLVGWMWVRKIVNSVAL
jgi:tight adherence protein B